MEVISHVIMSYEFKIFMDKAHGRIDSIFATNFLIGIFGSSF